MEGKLIVIEGASDGIGKTTQFIMLKERLLNENIEVITHHFPSYNTSEGIMVEEYLKGKFGNINDLSPYFINSLYAVDRAATWIKTLKKEYESGKVILLDRYTTSSLIYQSALIESDEEKKKFIDYVNEYEYIKLGIKKPDKVIFLNAPFELISELRNKRIGNDGILKDIHESDNSFMKKVSDNAQMVSKYLNWDIINCEENNQFRKIEDIHEEIYKLIKKM